MPKAHLKQQTPAKEEKVSRTDLCECPDMIEERPKPSKNGVDDEKQVITYKRGRFLGKVSLQ